MSKELIVCMMVTTYSFVLTDLVLTLKAPKSFLIIYVTDKDDRDRLLN